MSNEAYQVVRRFLNAKSDKKRMIVMMGPPAAGKGFFLGEPPPKYGWKLPQMLINDKGDPLLTDADIPERPEQDESDNHLRAIQFEEANKHFEALKKAHGKGTASFKKALSDHWYETKDGERVELGKVVKHEDFPDNFGDFFKKTNKDFYVSMRGWHDDVKEKNEETGKPKERFKDKARYHFEESVNRKIEKVEDLLIVDSAGEDIDAQDYKGQIDAAKSHGYEVTVIFLHPEQADTELSNLARGKVMGKRMVDQSDISNWYKQNAQALEDIQKASPDNFIHYRKGPPDPNPKKAEELRTKAREMMYKLSGMKDEEKDKAKKEINKILYASSPYKLHKPTSYGRSLNGLPKESEKDSIANAIKAMNEDAEKRAKPTASEKGKDKEEQKDKPNLEEKGKDDKDSTRIRFLRERGDQEVLNPNPDSKDRFPKVKIRSLDWKYQKPYYEKWRGKQATRVITRYLEAKMAEEKGLIEKWMEELAKEIESKVKIEGYSIATKTAFGPIVYVTIKDASEDSTAARKARQAIEKIIEASIRKNSSGVHGFKPRIQTYNKGADLLVECEVVFP